MKTDIIICGACGKMGTMITELAEKDEAFIVRGGIEHNGHPLAGSKTVSGVKITDKPGDIITGREVVIDFSLPDATVGILQTCVQKKAPVVTGTTGLGKEQLSAIVEASSDIPVFFAPNMSFGVNLFFEVVKFASTLMKDYEVEVSETHHHFKKDAPSGTAKKIAEIICSASGRDYEKVVRHGRQGTDESRSPDEIGMHSLRLGDIVGEHYVYFGGSGEIIELSHRCYNRQSFAEGALKAAAFIADKPPGLYGMHDLIAALISKFSGA